MATKTPRTTIEKKKSAPAKATTKKAGRAVSETAVKKPRRTAVKQGSPVPVLETAPAPATRRRPLFQAGTWISILMLAALIGLAFYLNREKDSTVAEDTTPTAERSFIFSAADGLVAGIEIQPSEGEAVKMERNAENTWVLILPTEAEADQGTVEAAATQLLALPITSQIEAGKSPEIFGLDSPNYVLTVEFKDGKTRTLEVGDSTPTNKGYYVRVDKDRTLITDINGIDALLQLVPFPPYLNTPVPAAESTVTPTP
jgi:hypothetical protein